MKIIYVFLGIIITTISWAKPVLDIKSWQSNHGAKVFFVRTTQLPMLDVNVIFKAGSAYDGNFSGVSSFVNNMLGEGTKTLSSDEVAERFDSTGAEFDVSSGLDVASIHLRSLVAPRYLRLALATFADVLSHPRFSDQGVSRIRNQTLAGIKYQQQLPGMIAHNLFYKNLYKDSPYAHPVYGTEKTVKGLSKKALIDFYKHYYVAKNSKIVLVGDITLKQAHLIAEQISRNLRPGEKARDLSLEKRLRSGRYIHYNFPSAQSTIMLGQVGINSQNPMYTPLVVGSYIMGGMPLSSILFKQVRDQRGLAYFATSQFISDSARGPFVILLKTRAEKTKEAISVVRKVLEDYIAFGPTVGQLEAAKKNLVGGFPQLFDSNKKILNLVSSLVINNRPLNYYDNYVKRINALTPSIIQKSFSKILHPKNMLTIIVGPKNNV